jgi:hypothetical protein
MPRNRSESRTHLQNTDQLKQGSGRKRLSFGCGGSASSSGKPAKAVSVDVIERFFSIAIDDADVVPLDRAHHA